SPTRPRLIDILNYLLASKNAEMVGGPIFTGTPFLQMHPVPTGNARELQKVLEGVYKPSATCRIVAVDNNTLAVYAGPNIQMQIGRPFGALPDPDGIVTAIQLTTTDAEKVAPILQKWFEQGPFIDVDATNNRIIVRGSREQI